MKMGCNQSKTCAVKEAIVQTKSKGNRRWFLQMLRRKRVNKVSPSTPSPDKVSKSEEDIASTNTPVPPTIQSCQVVENLYGHLKIVPVEELTPAPSPSDWCEEEVFAEGCNYDMEDNKKYTKKYLDRVNSERFLTVAEKVDLELDRPPTPDDLNITGMKIQPVLSEEQQEAFR